MREWGVQDVPYVMIEALQRRDGRWKSVGRHWIAEEQRAPLSCEYRHISCSVSMGKCSVTIRVEYMLRHTVMVSGLARHLPQLGHGNPTPGIRSMMTPPILTDFWFSLRI